MKNLKALGFPQVREDHVLLKTVDSDKEPRRRRVREGHRIVLLIGDNLNDFDSIFMNKGVDDRFSAVDELKDRFGRLFIVLPNPMYGAWEGAVYNYNWRMPPKRKIEARKAHLTVWGNRMDRE